MKYAVIQVDTIVNIIEWNGADDLEISGTLLQIDNEPFGINWTFDGTSWNPPPDPYAGIEPS